MSASFENSAMKSSFSLSSLRSGAAPSAGAGEQLERPYHSLTKKRKEPCREAWRRSWGSAASGGSVGDDLWPLLQHHYDYIMDNQIIDTCKEANGELSSSAQQRLVLTPSATFNRQWSLSQLVVEFTELCQWLTRVQEEIYSSPENLTSRKLRSTRMSELVSVEPRRIKFVEQASAILERIPEASAEVTWRVEHLNAKWEGLRLLLSPEQGGRVDDSLDTVDTAHELRCLRRWLHMMEGRLPPPSLAAAQAPYHELTRRIREHQITHTINEHDDDFAENTFKHYYYGANEDDSSTSYPPLTQHPSKRPASKADDSLDEFFEEPKKKKTSKSSTVGRATKDGMSYISTNKEDQRTATHLIKIEVYDLKKLNNVDPAQHWKHADVRVKYYVGKQSDHHKKTRALIYSITKEITSSAECKKYTFTHE